MFPTQFATTEAGHVLNAVPDLPDIRDFAYEPTLKTISYPKLDPSRGLTILDQGNEGACTGFALAAVINQLMRVAERKDNKRYVRVSPRMLYKMAQLHDEWPGENYSGSSLRGAIRGWHNMGVCKESLWPHSAPADGDEITIDRAINARENTLGSYYRLSLRLPDFHAALNETGVLCVSAQVHEGWERPKRGIIKPSSVKTGGHAFAIVGYNELGFWVQNSWGQNWGRSGLALWMYEDWVENLMDAWVVQVAFPTPQVFGRTAKSALTADVEAERRKAPAPRRVEIAGHFVHIDDGDFKRTGKYWSRADDIEQTAQRMASGGRYEHLLIYAHGGLNSPEASAARIAALKDGFKRNGIYPFHIMYDTGLAEEVKDILLSKFQFMRSRTEGFFDALGRFKDRVVEEVTERSDNILEGLTRTPGTAIWRETKRDARIMFDDGNAGLRTLEFFLHAFGNGNEVKIHMVGHSTGAVLLARLLNMTRRRAVPFDVQTLALLAPACTIDLFKEGYIPSLRGEGGGANLKRMTVYNLTDEYERDDSVIQLYRKSLLYLVSNAFEDEPTAKIAGMAKFNRSMPRHSNLQTVLSNPNARTGRSKSKSHGGFDNDPSTMNDVLKTILGRQPPQPFREEELSY